MKERKSSIAVCIVGSLPHPIGGVATYCYNLSKQLCKLGLSVDFFDTNYNRKKKIPEGIARYEMLSQKTIFDRLFWLIKIAFRISSLELTARVIYECLQYAIYLRISGIINVCIVTFSLYDFIKHRKVDLIHTQHAYLRSLGSLIVGKTLKIPVVVTIFSSEFTSSSLKKLRTVASHICNKANYIISISEHAKNIARKNKVYNSITVNYLGVDSSYFDYKSNLEELKIKYKISNETVILYVGWLTERKGPQILLESITIIKSKKIGRASCRERV